LKLHIPLLTAVGALLAVLVVITVAQEAAGPALPTDWKHWLYSRAIEVEPVEKTGLAQVTLPLEVFGSAQKSLADLRIIEEDGREVPSLLHTRPGRRERDWRNVPLVDTGYVPGEYTQVVVDTGTSGEIHNTLELVTPEEDFFARVDVAASEDQNIWRLVRTQAPIFRFHEGSELGSQTITYPDTRSRWVRLRIREIQLLLTRCRVARELVEEAELAALPAERQPMSDPPESASGWEVDVGAANTPVSVLRFKTGQYTFHRPVRILFSGDRENWTEAGRGEIYRYPSERGDLRSTSLTVEFNEARGRYWRVLVVNRNDPPLEGLRFDLLGVPRHVVFEQKPGRRYRLLYGHRRAIAPQYELARLTTRELWEAAPVGRLGERLENTGWEDPAPPPWSERNPWVLWIALLAAVGVLGWLALRSLQQPG
jgi:hypothetical protein